MRGMDRTANRIRCAMIRYHARSYFRHANSTFGSPYRMACGVAIYFKLHGRGVLGHSMSVFHSWCFLFAIRYRTNDDTVRCSWWYSKVQVNTKLFQLAVKLSWLGLRVCGRWIKFPLTPSTSRLYRDCFISGFCLLTDMSTISSVRTKASDNHCLIYTRTKRKASEFSQVSSSGILLSDFTS